MKNVMKHIAMLVLVVALAAGGYMAYQHYFAAQDEVRIQQKRKTNGGGCINCL